MQKDITVSIANIGDNVGTIGWLVNQPIEISIGLSKGGHTGCWLKIAEKSELVCAFGTRYETYAGWYPADGVNDIDVVRMDHPNMEDPLAFGVTWTDAAWTKVEELIELAREQFRAEIDARDNAEDKISLQFAVSRKG